MVTSQWLLLHGTPLDPPVWGDVSIGLSADGGVSCPLVVPHGPVRTSWELAGDVLRRTAGRLGVVGHSFGGQVGLDMALQAPDQVTSLTMICSRDTPFPSFAALAESLRQGGSIDVEGSLRRWFSAAAVAAETPMVRYARRCLSDVDPHAWADALDSIATFDRSHAVSALRIPVRLVAAEHDTVSTPATMTEMAARIPGARYKMLPDTTHMSVFDHPDILVQLILGTDQPGTSGSAV